MSDRFAFESIVERVQSRLADHPYVEMLGRGLAFLAGRSPLHRVTLRYVRAAGRRVKAGPFEGIVFPRAIVPVVGDLVPKLLGSYERELHPVVSRLMDQSWDLILNLGSADGYYAVGLAKGSPHARVYAVDLKPLAALSCQKLAAANGVESRVVPICADASEILGEVKDRTLLIVDCEGCEDVLLDPEAVPALRAATLLVELHEAVVPGVTDRIRSRFESTHRVELIPAEPRYAADHPELSQIRGMSYVHQEIAVSEFRPTRMSWAVLTPTA